MPDLCDLILDDHGTLRRRFAELDELRRDGTATAWAAVWAPLADLLEVHAASEEELFYPRLLGEGADGTEETKDAIKDHNQIRDAIRRAAGTALGTDPWWSALQEARDANSDHMAEEERGAISDFRLHAPADEREQLGNRWIRFRADHARRRDVDTSDKDVEDFVLRHARDRSS